VTDEYDQLNLRRACSEEAAERIEHMAEDEQEAHRDRMQEINQQLRRDYYELP